MYKTNTIPEDAAAELAASSDGLGGVASVSSVAWAFLAELHNIKQQSVHVLMHFSASAGLSHAGK